MQKYAVLVGEDAKGKLSIIDSGTDVDALVKRIEQLTDAKGVVKEGKSEKVYCHVELLHNRKGVIKRRNAIS